MADRVSVNLITKVRRDYGVVGVEFGASATFDIDETFTIRQGYRALLEMIERQFDEYEANDLPKTKHTAIDARADVGAAVDPFEWMAATAIIRETKGAKVYYSIKTQEAAFALHGCPMYDEVLKRYPRMKDACDRTGEYQFKEPLRVKILKSNKPDGKGRKVLEIEGAS